MPVQFPNAEDCYNTARMMLNDVNQQLWDDEILAPMMAQAHLELQAKLKARASPIMKAFADVTIDAYETIMTDIPNDITSPIQLWERPLGAPASSFQLMTETDLLPLYQAATTQLNWWMWFQEEILFVGATGSVDVLMLYWRSLQVPVLGTDSIGILEGQQYLGPRIAALAMGSVGEAETSSVADTLAQSQLQLVMAANRGRAPQNLSSSIRP